MAKSEEKTKFLMKFHRNGRYERYLSSIAAVAAAICMLRLLLKTAMQRKIA